MSQRVIIIAGPNGAGKSTFAQEYLPKEADCPFFVNADLIAAGLAPFAPEQAAARAGRIMLAEIREHVRRRESFAFESTLFESTLAGRTYARMIPEWRGAGYGVHIVFLKLNTVELAVQRVAERVAQGGHEVGESAIRRRFAQGWRNFNAIYRPLVNSWQVYDNSGVTPVLLERGSAHDTES